MARYGTLGDYRFSDTQEAALDIRGANVYGPKDQKLGEIAELDRVAAARGALMGNLGEGICHAVPGEGLRWPDGC